jgi:ADP-heptose:LPS heptosyltransferase
MGDVLLTTGVLEYWRRERGYRFDMLVRAQWESLLEGHPAIERVLGLDAEAMDGAAWLKTASELARRYEGWGLLDLHGNLRSRALSLLWRGPVRRYPKSGWLRRVYLFTKSSALKERLARVNVPQRYALALERIAPPAAELRPRLFLDEAPDRARRGLEGAIPGRSGLVALHPFATHTGKAWPWARWRELIDALDAARIGWFWIGRTSSAQREDAAWREAAQRAGQGLDFVDRASLRETATLLAAADALVTADSGPMHLATAVSTPTVALFGPTDAAWGFYPSGERDRVLETRLACRPCSLHGKIRCQQEQRCLADIEAGQVFAALKPLLP